MVGCLRYPLMRRWGGFIVPIMGVVAFFGVADANVRRASGADLYLTKPTSLGELEAAIGVLARRLPARAARVGLSTRRLTEAFAHED